LGCAPAVTPFVVPQAASRHASASAPNAPNLRGVEIIDLM
jgi:hypothetical protein